MWHFVVYQTSNQDSRSGQTARQAGALGSGSQLSYLIKLYLLQGQKGTRSSGQTRAQNAGTEEADKAKHMPLL